MKEELTHWKKMTHPDYLGSWAFLPGEEKILTMKEVKEETVTGAEGKKSAEAVMYFMEDVKPLILNNVNRKAISRAHRTPYIQQWAGKKIQLYVKPDVKAFGEVVDAVRIREYEPEYICSDCKQEIKSVKLGDNLLSVFQVSKTTKARYGRPLCMECGAKAKAAIKEAQQEQPEQETNDGVNEQ